MKNKKKSIRILLGAFLAIIAIAFVAIQTTGANEFKQGKFIAFSKSDYNTVSGNDFTRVSFDEIKDYNSVYSRYNQYQYYKNLNESEKIIYKSLEYALDNSCSVVFIDEKILNNSNYDCYDIFSFLTLDSAIAEQNNVFQETEDFLVFFDGETRLKTPVRSAINGNICNVNIFDTKKLKSKQTAIKKAEEIVAALPKGLTDLEKAKRLYSYLQENVEYIDYSNEQEYLYDTLILGKSNCDGFTNSYSLLCKLAGIPCFEKMYSPPKSNNDENTTKATEAATDSTKEATEATTQNSTDEKNELIPDDVGHTWNAVLLDGKWYNVDATNADFYFEADGCEKLYLFFGFSDKNSIYPHDFEEITPKCTDDLLVPDCTLKSFADKDAVSKMKKAFYENDSKYILVYSEEQSDRYDATMQDFANAIRDSIYYENFNEYFNKFYFVYPQ
ncbi:MAG: hypothetical protein J6V78_05910 [Clostridia bacterium]|nr:hypothetical protein [Clostridia bacterium]